MIRFFISRAFLTNRQFLWMLFIVNALGTIYGYMWYGAQLVDTAASHPAWQLVFVPDSPTASLFFTLSLLFLMFPLPAHTSKTVHILRRVLEGLAVVTSIKYGIWAVAMILAGAAKGDELVWQQYMLMVSHLGMAIEALLYVRFFVFGRIAALVATCWLWLNDTVDYHYGVYPYLPRVLDIIVDTVRNFTFGLTLFSFLLTLLALVLSRGSREREIVA